MNERIRQRLLENQTANQNTGHLSLTNSTTTTTTQVIQLREKSSKHVRISNDMNDSNDRASPKSLLCQCNSLLLSQQNHINHMTADDDDERSQSTRCTRAVLVNEQLSTAADGEQMIVARQDNNNNDNCHQQQLSSKAGKSLIKLAKVARRPANNSVHLVDKQACAWSNASITCVGGVVRGHKATSLMVNTLDAGKLLEMENCQRQLEWSIEESKASSHEAIQLTITNDRQECSPSINNTTSNNRNLSRMASILTRFVAQLVIKTAPTTTTTTDSQMNNSNKLSNSTQTSLDKVNHCWQGDALGEAPNASNVQSLAVGKTNNNNESVIKMGSTAEHDGLNTNIDSNTNIVSNTNTDLNTNTQPESENVKKEACSGESSQGSGSVTVAGQATATTKTATGLHRVVTIGADTTKHRSSGCASVAQSTTTTAHHQKLITGSAGNQQHQLQDKLRTQRENMEQKRERKAAKTLAIITGVFVCCWLPFFVNALLMPICGEPCTPSDFVLSIMLWLGYANSLLNPIIYTIFSPDFRRAFRRLLCGLPVCAWAHSMAPVGMTSVVSDYHQ